MLAEWLPVAVEGGFLAIIASVFGMLHRSAVTAYRETAMEWRETARLEREAHDQTREQLLRVLAPLSERAS